MSVAGLPTAGGFLALLYAPCSMLLLLISAFMLSTVFCMLSSAFLHTFNDLNELIALNGFFGPI